MLSFNIGNKEISRTSSTFVIAEAGVNHNGDLELAKRLIDASVHSGADAVKFQTFVVNEGTPKKLSKVDYQKKQNVQESMYEMLIKLEFGINEFKEIKDYCDKKKIIFLSTASDFKSLEIVNELGVPAYKIGSADITNIPLIRKIAEENKPVIISTGMSDTNEIQEAVEAVKSRGNEKIIILQCTSNYPTEIGDVNLNVIKTFLDKYKYVIGFSDHTMLTEISVAAVALGSRVIERHITVDNNLPGPDHKSSLNPRNFLTMVKAIRNVENSLGSFEKKTLQSELQIKKLMRRSIFVVNNLNIGDIIKPEDLKIMKSEGGLHPRFLNELIGKPLLKKKKAFEKIMEEDIFD